ncbi:MAG: hypothetical protein RRY65_07380 [Pseudoflavonifractor sp.]
MDRKQKTERQRQEDAVLNKVLIWFGSATGLELILFLLGRFWAGPGGLVRLLTYLVPIVAVLALIYYLYQHEFFVIALVSSLGILGLWGLFHEGTSTRMCITLVVMAVLLVGLALVLRVLQKCGGVIAVKGKPAELLPKNANYALLYITCGIMAVILAAALVLTGAAAINTMIFYAAPVAWLLIMAVYYTVKLM